MTQYQETNPDTTGAPTPVSTPRVSKDVRDLRDRLQEQQRQIQALERTVRKLQNELRVAVNTFNLTRGG